jgi:hypothetical protein
MPTSLPVVVSADVIECTKSSTASSAIWLVLIWAAVMLLFVALGRFGADAGAIDPFQLLATF